MMLPMIGVEGPPGSPWFKLHAFLFLRSAAEPPGPALRDAWTSTRPTAANVLHFTKLIPLDMIGLNPSQQGFIELFSYSSYNWIALL